MNHCVPIWDIAEEDGSRTNNNIILHSTLNSSVPISESRGHQQQQMVEETVEYDVAELTWKNGQLGLHGLTSSSSSSSSSSVVVVPARPSPPVGGHTTHRASAGTLESIVDLAIQKHGETNHYNNEELKELHDDDDDDPTPPPPFPHHKNIVFDRLVPWFDHRSVVLTREQDVVGGSGSVRSSSGTGSTMMDALVPSGNNSSSIIRRQDQKSNTKISRRSNRGAADDNGDRRLMIRGDNDKHRAAATAAVAASWRGTSVTGNGRNIIVRGKTTREDGGGDSCAQVSEKKADCMHVNHESTVEKTIATSAQSIGSGGTGKQQMVYSNRKSYYSNTMATTSLDDSSCHSRPIPHPLEEEGKNGGTKSSGSTKRSRAAAVHNQSERKRREKINERIKTLQKLVPNSSKIDKASMLDEVIEYLKQLQAQVNMMSKLNVPSMMMSMAFMQQQQQQMSMMAAMGMFNMGMDINMNMNPLLMAAHHNPLISSTTTTPPATNSGAGATASFVPMTMTAPWDGLQGNRLPAGQTSMPPMMSNTQAQPLSTMEMDAYNRMLASSYQQMRQQQHSASTS